MIKITKKLYVDHGNIMKFNKILIAGALSLAITPATLAQVTDNASTTVGLTITPYIQIYASDAPLTDNGNGTFTGTIEICIEENINNWDVDVTETSYSMTGANNTNSDTVSYTIAGKTDVSLWETAMEGQVSQGNGGCGGNADSGVSYDVSATPGDITADSYSQTLNLTISSL